MIGFPPVCFAGKLDERVSDLNFREWAVLGKLFDCAVITAARNAVHAFIGLGRILAQQGEFEEAEKALRARLS